MKKVFFIILFICSSFVYGQNQEKLVISGWKQETGVIDYYENGLIKNFTYGSNSISCTDNIVVACTSFAFYAFECEGNNNAVSLFRFGKSRTLPANAFDNSMLLV